MGWHVLSQAWTHPLPPPRTPGLEWVAAGQRVLVVAAMPSATTSQSNRWHRRGQAGLPSGTSQSPSSHGVPEWGHSVLRCHAEPHQL